MNIIVVYLLFFFSTNISIDTDKMRKDFHDIDSKEQLHNFLEIYQTDSCIPCVPYIASSVMRQASFTKWPNKKIAFFFKGKKQLESFINKYPNDIEGRYVRVITQDQLPAFLGYKHDIQADIKFIAERINNSILSSEYQDFIMQNINSIEIK